MKTFDEYWERYGELHASMCGGDIKQFAKEIWESAIEKGFYDCPVCEGKKICPGRAIK